MKRRTIGIFSIAAICLASLGAVAVSAQPHHRGWFGQDFWLPGWMRDHMWGRGRGNRDMQSRMERHWTFMHEGLPEAYKDARSTIDVNETTIAEGGQLYAAKCASCHGNSGLGDGDAGKSLTPSPALLSYMIQRPISIDSYLLWTVSEGGVAFGTGMPAFKDSLSQEEIWKIIAYMRAGFPQADGAKPK